MDWVQLHLALNHIPVVGIPLLVLLLLAAWGRKSHEATRLLLWSLLALAVAAIAIKFTGDFAADQFADRFTEIEEFVHRHEEAGDQVTAAAFVLALLVGIALWLARRGRPVPSWAHVLVLAAGLVTSLLYVRSAHTGGQISHVELRP